ncbi:MAG TPA: universal stress protein, partial [Ktedonobacterales bacterium]|nr:universal stress protein [Ktedonobacterales bacterium]
GEPEEAIKMAAHDEQCDLIVVAAQPRQGLETLVHPRLTPRLEAHAAIPVLIWPEGIPADATEGPLAHAGAPVLVPLDGSPYAEEALPLAASLAREFRRSLTLVHVVAPGVLAVTSADAAAVAEMEIESDERVAREYLKGIRHRMAATTGLPVESMIRMGDPADEFLHLAESHPGSLIVMSTHGRSGLARFFIGSVAGHIVRRAHVPVLIIPPRAVREKAIPQLEQLAVDAVEH